MGLLSALFGDKKPEKETNPEEKEKQKKFDILKYDGIRARNMGKLPYSIKCFEEAVALNDEPETLELLANAYLRAGRTEDARATFVRLTEKEASNINALLSLASVCYMLEDYKGTDEACRKAIALDGKNVQAYFLAAKAAKGTGNSIDAIVMLTKAIALDESFMQAFQFRAEILWEMRQAKEATEDLDHILSSAPTDEDALLLKGKIEAALGHTDEACSCFDKVMEANPFNETAYLMKGGMLGEIKRLAEAETLYTEAIDLMPGRAVFYQERGRIRLLEGNETGAIDDMKKAIEIEPEKEGQISGSFSNFGKNGLQTGIY